MASESEHKFEVGDKFTTLETWLWTITNRMVDVDTGELVYYIQGLSSRHDNHGKEKVISEKKLEMNYTPHTDNDRLEASDQ